MIQVLGIGTILVIVQAVPAFAERVTLACSLGAGYHAEYLTIDTNARTVKGDNGESNINGTYPALITEIALTESKHGSLRSAISGNCAHMFTGLLDKSACAWNESDVPLHQRGVRLKWLQDFVHSIYKPYYDIYLSQIAAQERAEAQRKAHLLGVWDNIPWPEPVTIVPLSSYELTTQEFVDRHVVPLTHSLRAPLYARIPHSERGEPTCFLSHAWSHNVLAFNASGDGTLDAFGTGVSTHEFVWIDFACYNQHTLTPDTIAFDMEELIKCIGKVAFAVTGTNLFDRIWCLWELIAVSRASAKVQFCVGARYRPDMVVALNRFFEGFISVEVAHATKREDTARMLAAMGAVFGSIAAANNYIRDLMRENMSDGVISLTDGNKRRGKRDVSMQSVRCPLLGGIADNGGA